MAEFSYLRMRAFAAKQIPAEFAFELTDGARERGLGHVAFFGRSRKIEGVRNRQEIANLMHLHCAPPIMADPSQVAGDASDACQ